MFLKSLLLDNNDQLTFVDHTSLLVSIFESINYIINVSNINISQEKRHTDKITISIVI